MPMVPNNFSGLITFTRASGATFVGSNGLIQLAATNVPRFDYDPVTLAVKGLLIEEQRTNLLTYSEQFDNAYWSKAGPAADTYQGTGLQAVVTANQGIAPDGTLTADRLILDLNGGTTTNDRSGFSTSVTVSPALTYTSTLYIKPLDGTTQSQLESSSNIGSLAAGGTATQRYATPVGNGWFRLVQVIQPVNTSGTWRVQLVGGVPGALAKIDCLIWGAQLEAGAFATSYIPTVASQVTRSADVALVNTLSPWYNAAEGTLYAEVSTVAASARAATFSAGTVTNQLWVQGGGTSERALQVYTSDAFVAQIGVLPSTLTKKIAGAYQTNNFAVSIDGGAAATDTSGAIGFFDRMNIGSRFDGVASTNGHIRRITYYPRRLSNAELQALTV